MNRCTTISWVTGCNLFLVAIANQLNTFWLCLHSQYQNWCDWKQWIQCCVCLDAVILCWKLTWSFMECSGGLTTWGLQLILWQSACSIWMVWDGPFATPATTGCADHQWRYMVWQGKCPWATRDNGLYLACVIRPQWCNIDIPCVRSTKSSLLTRWAARTSVGSFGCLDMFLIIEHHLRSFPNLLISRRLWF